ncbi:hypothetical protein JCM3770_004971 [Rhodotorula araucariae]
MQLPPSQTASSLLRSSRSSHRFSSTCGALDALITPQSFVSTTSPAFDALQDAGLCEGAVLELLGPPGIGKTKTALGFVLAERFRDDGGEVLVIDAEGSLVPSFIKETAELYGEHSGYDASFVRVVLEGIRYRRIDSAWMLVAVFNSLDSWLMDHPKVTLIIVDSLSSHLRPTLDSSTRTHIADTIRASLSIVCATGRVSVIFTTQLSLKLFGPNDRPSRWSRDAEALLVPQITERWIPREVDAWRVLQYYDEQGERLARLLSSPAPTQATDAAFAMDALGLCDVPEGPAELQETPA